MSTVHYIAANELHKPKEARMFSSLPYDKQVALVLLGTGAVFFALCGIAFVVAYVQHRLEVRRAR